MGRPRAVRVRDRRRPDSHPGQPGLPGLRRRDPGVAVRDPGQPCRRTPVETARGVCGRGRDRRAGAVDHQRGHRGAAVAFRSLRPPRHAAFPIRRRPALDRDARRGADRLGAMAARAVAALVVGAAAGVRADPSRHQRRGSRAVAVRAGRRLVHRCIGRARRRNPRARRAAGGGSSRDGPSRVRRVRAQGGAAVRCRAADPAGGVRAPADDGRDGDVRTDINAAAACSCSCGARCGCATERLRPCTHPCAAPSNTGR